MRLLPMGPTVGCASWKLVWLKTLNASARNCSCKRSENRKLLNSDVSRLTYPGPRKVLRPREKLECNETAKTSVFGLVNDAHPTRPQLFQYAVVGYGLSDHWGECYVGGRGKSMKTEGFSANERTLCPNSVQQDVTGGHRRL